MPSHFFHYPQLDPEEFSSLVFQNGISSWGAIMINIQIMRIFTKMRQFLNDTTQIHLELTEVKLAVEKLSKKQDGHDKNIDLIFPLYSI